MNEEIIDVMTREEFFEFANVWYQRTHKLRIYWNDESKSSERKAKAYLLWWTMRDRVLDLIPTATRLSVPIFKDII